MTTRRPVTFVLILATALLWFSIAWAGVEAPRLVGLSQDALTVALLMVIPMAAAGVVWGEWPALVLALAPVIVSTVPDRCVTIEPNVVACYGFDGQDAWRCAAIAAIALVAGVQFGSGALGGR